ncbi:hypothetical protein HY009_04895 [Candidatus Acetothermia bacterium]|nr:hypothetical protein [Candidatus Acetothermia bacterium]
MEGESDEVLFEHVVHTVLKHSETQVQVASAGSDRSGGINRMLDDNLPNACELIGKLYRKVIAVFDEKNMHEPHRSKSRIQYLKDMWSNHPLCGGFPVRSDLEDLIERCLLPDRRKDFRERVRKSKVQAAHWAIQQGLDEHELKTRITELAQSLNCQLYRDFV